MADYRYIAVDLLTHTVLAELPLTGVKWGRRLNGAGPLTAKLPLPVGTANATLAAIYVDATQTKRRAIYVDRGGVLQWGGPLWARKYDTATRTVELVGQEWPSILDRREIRDTKTYSSVTDDQLAIVRDLINYTQAKPGGNIGILLGTEISGIKRDRVYDFYTAQKIGDAIRQLAACIDGFDFSIDVAYNGSGGIDRTLHLWYPRQGRLAGNTGHVWALGRNIVSFTVDEKADKSANSMFGIGNGQGDLMLRSTATRADLLGVDPLLEDSISLKDVKEQATLDGRTLGAVNSRADVIALPQLVVRGDLDPQIGAFICGDEGRIMIEPGLDPFYPNGLDTYRRIVAFDVEPSDNGAENVTLTLDKAIAA